MPSKFGGIPVDDEQPRSKFGGIPVDDDRQQAPQRTVAQEAGRSLGLGVRAMGEGAAGLIGVVSDPLTAGMDALRNKLSPQTMSGLVAGREPVRTAGARETAGQLADMIGLPRPETGTERVAGNITEAVTGGGGWIAGGRALAAQAPGVVRNVGNALAAMPGTQVAAAAGGGGASGVTREGGGGAGAQAVAGLVGGLSPSFGLAALKGGTRYALRGGEEGRAAMEQGIKDFRMVGAQPSVGQATGNRRTQGLESLLAGGPTSGGVMARAGERQAADIGVGLQGKADSFFRNASAERAGSAVEKGVDAFVGKVGATRNALYKQADQLIPGTTRLPLTRTQQALTDLTALTPGAESTTASLVNPKIAQMAKDVGEDLMAAQAGGSGGMPYAAVRDLRTRIGAALSDFSLTTDKPTAEYKRLYAALSQDLEEAARQQGPDAAQAMQRANMFYKVSAERLKNVERVVDRNGGPENVFRAVMSGTQDGGTTLRAVMQSLPKDGQRAVTAAVIKRMGLPTKGQAGLGDAEFSAATFMTNWSGVSKEAKRALFDRHGPKFAADMDRIARVADRIKNGSKVFANPSGTANRVAAYTYGGSLLTAAATAPFTGGLPLAGLILSGVGMNVTARAMTNQRFVSALARSTEMPASALPQFILQLKREAATSKDEELAEIVAELEQGE